MLFIWLELFQVDIAANIQNKPHQELQYLHMKTCLPIEEYSRQILTPFTFNALQHELIVSMQYVASEIANGSYLEYYADMLFVYL